MSEVRSSQTLARPVARWADLELRAANQALMLAVAYGDVFDFPLSGSEVHRYLAGVEAPRESTDAALHAACGRGLLGERDGYFTLPGREHLVESRRRRAATAAEHWPLAVHFGRLLAGTPFVRMVAVTGALSVDNAEPGADIDYLIVTEPGRLWLCRTLVLPLVRLSMLRGTEICPNYFLSERALVLQDRTIFTAHELAQMVPLAGMSVYWRMQALNGWAREFLPNAVEPLRRPKAVHERRGPVQTLAELVLRSPVVDPLERWEMGRKVEKFRRRGDGNAEAVFSADWCKGHFEGHGGRILDAFEARRRIVETLLG